VVTTREKPEGTINETGGEIPERRWWVTQNLPRSGKMKRRGAPMPTWTAPKQGTLNPMAPSVDAFQDGTPYKRKIP